MENGCNKGSVIFYAPIGNVSKSYKSGGAEAGCKKTIEVLKKAGYNIILVEKPAKASDTKLEALMLLFRLFNVWIRLILLFLKHRNSIFHVAGFYLNQVYFEAFLIKTSKFFRVRSIYEIRNGGMIEAYYAGNSTYQSFMRVVLLESSLVLCQGQDYVDFLKKNFNRESFYYPNYIMDDFITPNDTAIRDNDIINVIFVGRIVPDKNVDFIVDVCNEVIKNKLKVKLHLIGSSEESYFKLLENKIKKYDLNDSVIFHGRMEFKDIYHYLKSSHFFVFPSKEKREGHSNALTEAMGCGVVPIVSDAGFNRSISGDDNLVINDFDPSTYALKVVDIWKNGLWSEYSNQVYSRTINNYTESIVKKKLENAYSTI